MKKELCEKKGEIYRMQYCQNCHLLCEGECPSCGNRKLSVPQPDDSVRLAAASSYLGDMLEELLTQHDIPFQKRSALTAEKKPAYHYYVAYRDYEQAQALWETIEPPAAEESDEDEETEDEKPRTYTINGEEFEYMNEKRRRVWRAVSSLIFLAVIILVVTFSDAAANWLRSLFGGG